MNKWTFRYMPILTILSCSTLSHDVAAQDLFITNARIIVGGGDVIDGGGIVVQSGRIVAVTEDELEFTVTDEQLTDLDLPVIDAQGLTVMPGFIDGNRQVIQGDPDVWLDGAEDRMREYLQTGITTVLAVDSSLEHMLALRDRLELGEIVGPRIFLSAPVSFVRDDGQASLAPEQIREAVRQMAYAGADGVTAAVHATPGDTDEGAIAVARAEADEQGLLLIAQVRSADDALTAVAGGSGYLIGTPRVGNLSEEMAHEIVETGRPNAEYDLVMTSALGTADSSAEEAAAVKSARTLRDAGIIYGFGTGTAYPPADALRRELALLDAVFSNEEIIDILTRSAAYSMRRDDALGGLRAGRMADIVLIDGDPLSDLEALFNVMVVIRNGQIVLDNRLIAEPGRRD